jgi:polysaccharide export outer membrane protein
VLGPDDQITIRGVGIEEIADKPAQIGRDGLVTLPMVGSLTAGGLTVRQFEAALTAKLSEFIRNPQISVMVTEYRSQPVSVLGAVNKAGVHQLQGSKTLTEVLSLADGIRPDAGYRIRIVRRSEWGAIPLPDAHPDETGHFSIGEVNLKDVLAAKKPEENIRICPYDVITVPTAELVYVIGQVNKAGGFVLNENESVSVLQALALAGGLSGSAAPKKARIIRPAAGGEAKVELPVDVSRILTGQAADMPLKADDILFIPLNAPKQVAIRAVEAAINIGTGVAIYH